MESKMNKLCSLILTLTTVFDSKNPNSLGYSAEKRFIVVLTENVLIAGEKQLAFVY